LSPSGKFAYVVGSLDCKLATYRIDPVSGALTAVAPEVATATNPGAVVVTGTIQ
jgi:hypothetical protein